jgi:hypothetical protein
MEQSGPVRTQTRVNGAIDAGGSEGWTMQWSGGARAGRAWNGIGLLVLAATLGGACGQAIGGAAVSRTSAAASTVAAGSAVRATAATSALAPAAASSAAAGPRIVVDGRILAGFMSADVEHYLLLDGTTELEVFTASGCAPCVWPSADGDLLVTPTVTSTGQLSAAVYTTGEPTGRTLPLPDGTINLAAGPWSPTADRFARAGWDDTDPGRQGVYTTKADGSGLKRITASSDGRVQEPLAWSARGDWIAVFQENPRVSGPHLGDVIIATADGAKVRQVNPDGTAITGIFDFGPPLSFSPDGRQIAFAARDVAAPDRSAVFVASTAGGKARRITSWTPGTMIASWSPDGASILFDRTEAAGPVIALIRPDGTGERAIWTSTASDPACCGAWSPTGEQVLVSRGTGAVGTLWVLDLDGSPVGMLGTRATNWFWYRWLPD